MKKIIYFIISAVNAGLMALYINYFIPGNVVAVHFNINGEPDRYGSKWEYMLLAAVPVVLCIIYAIVDLATNYMCLKGKNKNYINRIFGGTFIFFVVFLWLILVLSSTKTQPSNIMFGSATVLIGMLVMFIGNLMPKIKVNSIVGLRTKATLSNEFVWKKANRLSGFLAVFSGAVGVIVGLLSVAIGSNASYLLFAVVILFVVTQIAAVIYANKLSKKVCKNDSANNS